MPDGKLSLGEPVWAKLKGFSPWPGKIAQAPEGLRQPAKKRAHCVYFFGTENYAFIEPQFIKPFAQHREKLARINKSNQFKEALAVIDDYLLQQQNGTPVQQSGTEPTTTATKKEKTKKPAKEDSSSPKKRGPKPAGEKKPKKVADPTAKKEKKEKKALTNGTSPKKTAQSANKVSTDADKPKKKRKPAVSVKRPAAVADQSFSPEISPPPKKARQQSPAYDGDDDRVPAVGVSVSRRLPDSDSDAFSSLLNHSASTKRVASLLNRPTLVTRPETPPLDVGQVSSTLKEKNIRPSELRFGLLGLGVMGSGIGKNLLNSGHQLHVWNRSSEKCDHYVKAGAEHGLTPSDVVGAADVTFCCVSEPQVTKDIIYGNCGVLQEINTTKGYVEMTGIDSETSQDVADAIGAKGGRYLEAQVQGSRQQAEEGTLVILCSGDRSLFDDCQSCFQAMGKNSFYLGEVGNASKMNLVLQLVYGVQMAALAEGMALADRAGLRQKDVLEVLTLTDQACPLLLEKGRAIIEGGFSTQMALKHMQKDLRLCMSLSDQLEQPLPLTSTANEIFKHAKRVGYGDHDVAAVYLRARF